MHIHTPALFSAFAEDDIARYEESMGARLSPLPPAAEPMGDDWELGSAPEEGELGDAVNIASVNAKG